MRLARVPRSRDNAPGTAFEGEGFTGTGASALETRQPPDSAGRAGASLGLTGGRACAAGPGSPSREVVKQSFVVSFICNVCGAENNVENFASEPATCACGSNVRVRALIHLLSLELFGRSFPLVEFPELKAIRALGMTDKEGYARLLAVKFDYTNT